MQKQTQTWRIAILVAAAVCAPSWLHAEDTVGYVIAVQGNWTAMPGAARLVIGSQLAAGTQVKPDARARSISIAYLDGSAKTYKEPFSAPVLRPAAGSSAGRIVSAVGKALGPSKNPTIFAMSRGSDAVRPAVLKLMGKRLDLAPAMGSLPSGEYLLELRPARGGDAVEGKCNYDPPATSATVSVAPGAYELHVKSASGTPTGAVMVLIVAPADFDAKTAAFQKGRELTASWPPDMDPEGVQQFLSALLLDLASPALP